MKYPNIELDVGDVIEAANLLSLYKDSAHINDRDRIQSLINLFLDKVEERDKIILGEKQL